ncbi:unnamed protein product [Pleuronectes platessa]|uniref:Uncharacterized protein n=1 Tax=Pleuronectes platessa TaxID=8262 RepID=A0A9N7Z9H1_PLEPL|nr:unnamed protein product [Pleuronectes platessa]
MAARSERTPLGEREAEGGLERENTELQVGRDGDGEQELQRDDRGAAELQLARRRQRQHNTCPKAGSPDDATAAVFSDTHTGLIMRAISTLNGERRSSPVLSEPNLTFAKLCFQLRLPSIYKHEPVWRSVSLQGPYDARLLDSGNTDTVASSVQSGKHTSQVHERSLMGLFVPGMETSGGARGPTSQLRSSISSRLQVEEINVRLTEISRTWLGSIPQLLYMSHVPDYLAPSLRTVGTGIERAGSLPSWYSEIGERRGATPSR